MASDAQISANRRNAKKSTEPKTAAGLAVASRNALAHGLTAEQLVVPGEEADDFMSFHEKLRRSLLHGSVAENDALEERLIERVVVCAWRLRRASRAEAGIAGRKAEQWTERGGEGQPYAGLVFVMAASEMLALSRYERAIERSLHRALDALERWQERRRLEAEIDERPYGSTPELPPLPTSNPSDPFDHRNYRTEAERAEVARLLEANRRLALGLSNESWATQE